MITDALVYGEGGGGSALEQAAAHGELTILMCQQVPRAANPIGKSYDMITHLIQ